MNTKEMQSIIELAKSLSFRQTAERLFISQPALSYQINAVEEEIGFKIFERNGKAVALTPAGKSFVNDLTAVYSSFLRAVERGQNFSSHYEKEIRILLPRRSYFPALPKAMERMAELRPEVNVVPLFRQSGFINEFHNGDVDLIIADEEDLKGVKSAKLTPLYRCPIRLIVRPDDVLASLPLVSKEHIRGRTMLVGSASRKKLRKLQLELERERIVNTLNSDSPETTITLVSAGKAICLSPEFYSHEGGEVAWIPFDTDVDIQISLLSKAEERRPEVLEFIELLKNA